MYNVANSWVNNAWSASQAQRAWYRSADAAKHAHQWEVTDLRNAGLNPILSATGGNGASIPPPMQGQVSVGKTSTPTDFMSVVNSARMVDLQERRMEKELELAEKKNEAEVDLMEAQADETVTRSWLNEDNSALTNLHSRQIGFTMVREAQKHDIDIANRQIELEMKYLERAMRAWNLSYEQTKGFYARLFGELGKISGGSVSSSNGGNGGKGGKGGKGGASSADSGDIAGAIDVAAQRIKFTDNIETDFKSFNAVETQAINAAKLYLLKTRKDRVDNYNRFSEYFKIDRRERKK